jgi:photosystem II stability/assembly factor-like uncharacterized protein
MLNPLTFRSIGPATFSGRIIDLAVNPKNFSEYYVATGSGGLWKTINSGTTYAPVFDNQPVYSIGALAIDPKNPEVLWVGTGENNSQRALAIGDGVYKTTDGGKTFVNTGLKKSEHIGKIVIDPRNSDVVFVAAQGPVWGPGGERGLYKTSDGGKSWERILYIGEYTGISDLECMQLHISGKEGHIQKSTEDRNLVFIKPLTEERHGREFQTASLPKETSAGLVLHSLNPTLISCMQ